MIAIQKPGQHGYCSYCSQTRYVYWTCDSGNRLRICMRCVKLINGGEPT